MAAQFRGSMVALVTPFQADGQIDWDALARLIDFQIDGGTHGLVICGTTGEAAAMSLEEQKKVLAFAVERTNQRVPVIAGTGSNNMQVALAASRQAKEVGVDGLLVVTPPYNKPTQEGLVRYYNAITDDVKMPVVLYNVPGRTACNMLPSTVEKLADNPYVVAIKDATADLAVGSEIVERCGDRVTLLSGDDFTALPLLSIGGQGWISVTANIAPAALAEMFNAWERGDVKAARAAHYKTFALHRAMFMQSNPIPVKAAAGLMGLCEGHTRLPLVTMEGEPLAQLNTVLQDHELLG